MRPRLFHFNVTMSTVKTITPIADSKEVETVVFVALDQQTSQYFREEDPENDGKSVRLAYNTRKIPNRSFVKFVDKDGMEVLKETRYIKNCPFIFIDEQDKNGYKPNPAADHIWLDKGQLIVQNNGSGVYLLKFLREGCSANLDCKNRSDNYKALFRELNTEVLAKNDEEILDTRLEATELVTRLRYKVGKQVIYDENGLEFFSELHKMPPFTNGFNSSEAFMSIYRLAEAEPDRFLSKYREAKSEVERLINQAQAMGVLSADPERATLADDAQSVVITWPVKKLNEDQRAELLMNHYLAPSNRIQLVKLQQMMAKAIAGGVNVKR